MSPENIPTINNDSQEYKSWRLAKHDKMITPVEVLRDIVLEATGSVLSNHYRIIEGEVNEVYSAETESGQEIVIRIFHGRKIKFYKEQWAFEECAKVGVPVPKMLLVKSTDVDGEPREICVESKLPGVHLNKIPEISTPEMERERVDLLHQIGQILSRIHSIPTNGFGTLDQNGNGKFSSVRDLISNDSYINKNRILPGLADRPDDLQTVLRAYEILEQESESYTSPSSSLVHNDISPPHIFVDQGSISGVIDMENACGADPVSDLARWDSKFGREYPLKYIIEGYENKRLFTGNFERKLGFWKIYKSLTSLSYNIEVNKPTGIRKSLNGLREALILF